MSWITATWSATAAVCLTFSGVHLLVWLQSRGSVANLLFSIAATAAAVCAGFELKMMHATTPEQYGEMVRWCHVPVAVLVVSLIWFVYHYLRSGRRWLAWLFCGFRLVTLILNFSLDPNLNFLEITGLRPISAWGDTFVSPIGVKNPLTNITSVGGLLFLAFVVDAAIMAWRRGNRRRALVVGFTFASAIAIGVAFSEMLNRGGAPIPFTLSLVFLLIALGMTYELSWEVLEANRLAVRLRENEERLRLATSAANLGVWEWDVAQDEIWVTKTIRSRVGLPDDERLSLNRFLETLHPDDRENTLKRLQQALDLGGEWQAEYRSGNSSGDFQWIAARGQVERGANGKPVRVRGVSLDITERRLAEQRLQQAAEFNQQVLASLDHEIAILDRSGTIIEVNDAWKNFAREKGDTIDWKGRDYLAVCRAAASLGDGRALEVQDGVRSVLEGARPSFDIEYHCLAPSTDRFYLMRVVPLRSPDGGAVVSHVDVTPLRRAELEAESLRQELAHLSRVSTMGQLSTALAHELSQPLGAILRNAEAAELLLKREPPDWEELQAIVIDIQQDELRAGSVIDRMRSLLKKRELKFESISLNRMVEQVLTLLRSELQFSQVSLDVELESGLPLVRGDAIHLQQVLLNLLTNALDAVRDFPSERRRVGVRARQSTPDRVEVAVGDHGAGIPEDQLERIFEPFVSTKADGMGMGLAICRSIIAAHGGNLWAENNADGGATFRCTLQVAEQRAKE